LRQIILDTETTGLEPKQGHRIIEVGCVELINRRLTGNNFHYYFNPQREIDAGAIEVHGLTNEFLEDKPLFEDIAGDLHEYLKGADIVIHNAPFDVGFINNEFRLMNFEQAEMSVWCEITDTLQMARKMFPGQRNSLDALCKRYEIDNSQRELHGALLDAEILADVYLMMTGGQGSLLLEDAALSGDSVVKKLDRSKLKLTVLKATEEELVAHEARLASLTAATQSDCLWTTLDNPTNKEVH
jgi:DNA polymerase-3 subunit epsilon